MKVYLCLIPLILVGCTKRDSEFCFAVVDGVRLTESLVRDSVLIEAKISELQNRPIRQADFNRWANARAMRMIGPMINAQLLENAARKEGLVPNTIDINQVLAKYSKRLGVKGDDFEDLAQKLGDLKDAGLRQMRSSALLSAYARVHWSDPLPDYVVKQYCRQVTNELNEAAQVNAAAKKNAEAAFSRLENGEDWAVVAHECSEDRLIAPANARFAKFWTLTGAEAFGITELASLLPLMKPGSYTRPLDTNQGMLIVRLNDKKNNLYHLSRMMFRMANHVVVPKNDKEAREIITARFLEGRQASTLKRLQSEAKIEYPMGTNITYRIWKEETVQ